MIHQLNMYGKDKVQVAIDRLKLYEPPEGYYLAFSGGKDSVVIKALADMAGVKYDAHYRVTSVDPPELVQFIKKVHPDVHMERPLDKNGNQITMWNLIPKNRMPPTQVMRYCCKDLKESGGNGRMTITGVRWAESSNRRANQGHITIYKGNTEVLDTLKESGNFTETLRGGVVLTNDNSDSRKMVEQCYKLSKTVVNPIIDWTDEDVWEFIHEHDVPYCKLYDEGHKRLGCIGCPMSHNAKDELERWPKYKRAYIKSFQRMLDLYTRPTEWKSGEDVMEWWLTPFGARKFKPRRGEEAGQMEFEDDEE